MGILKRRLSQACHYNTGVSKIGGRKSNQDSIYPAHPTLNDHLFIVSDGVGGVKYGKTASMLCNHLAERFFKKNLAPINKAYFNKLFHYIHAGFIRFKTNYPEYAEMATTTAILRLDNQHAHLGWAGDSRIYHVRNGEILFRTTDHTLAEHFKYRIDLPEDIETVDALNHVLVNSVSGTSPKEHLEYLKIKHVMEGDLFLICSDGVFNTFREGELEALLCSDLSPSEKKSAIESTCTIQAKDNYSFFLVEV